MILLIHTKTQRKARRLSKEIDDATGKFLSPQPTTSLTNLKAYVEDLFGESDQLALLRLLDGTTGAEGNLFLWVNTYPKKTYEDLVDASKKNYKDKRNRKPPNPGLLLDELPCHGGTDESSD